MSWKPVAALFVVLPIIDYFWIGLVAKNMYLEGFAELGRIEGGGFKPVIWAAVLVYVFLSVGISAFVLPRSVNYAGALALGALFGLIVYGVYDMTNYSTLTKYPLALSFIDMGWGTTLGAIGGLVGRWVESLG